MEPRRPLSVCLSVWRMAAPCSQLAATFFVREEGLELGWVGLLIGPHALLSQTSRAEMRCAPGCCEWVRDAGEKVKVGTKGIQARKQGGRRQENEGGTPLLLNEHAPSLSQGIRA